ncbi:MAG: hypothetical protein NC039_09125 [Muribaculaceae bacterium]|nr:hypothetical protein [Muribaculaceae bacterium]
MNPSALEACHKDLFTDIEELRQRYPKDTVDKILRVRDMYLHMLKTPSLTDSEIIRTFTARYKVSRPTAYSDLAVVKGLLPMLTNEAREFHRWRTLEMLLETYRIAKAKMDVRTMERVSSTYGRVTNADRPEEQTIDLSKIVPVQWVPTDDPTVLGLPRLPNREQKIKELLKEFSAATPEILDVTYDEEDLQLIQ